MTRQQLQQQCSSMTLQKITQALFKKAQTIAGIFKLTPPSAHLISTLRLKRNRVNDTASHQSTDTNVTFQHIGWPIQLDEGKKGRKKEGKRRNRSVCPIPHILLQSTLRHKLHNRATLPLERRRFQTKTVRLKSSTHRI